MSEGDKVQLAADLVAWLDGAQARQVLRLLIGDRDVEAEAVLTAAQPELPEGCALSDDAWREALLDALEDRIAPATDDPDSVKTQLLPNYAAYATDRRD